MSEKNLNTKKRGTIYELDLTLYSTSGCQYTLFLDYCDEKEIQTKINSIINRSILPRSPIIPPLPSPFPYMSQQNKVVEDENNDELPF